MRRLISMLALVVTLAVMAGCGDDNSTKPTYDPAGAQQEVTAGNVALANGDYAAANAHYKAAIAKDPGNTEGQFGAAVTEVYLLQDDSEISSVVNDFQLASRVAPIGRFRAARTEALSRRLAEMRASVGEGYRPAPMGRALFQLLALAADEPDSLSEIQALVRTKVMPALQYAENRLNTIEAASDFVMLIPPAITDLPDTVEIDMTEVYVLDALVNGVQGWLGVLVAYNFDVELMDYELVDVDSLLASGTDWATLHPGGVAILSAARSDLQTVKTRLDAAAAYLADEEEDQDQDVIPQEWLNTQDYADLYDVVQELYATLTGPVLVSVNDYMGQPFNLQFYFGRFFVPAIQDLKPLLPHLTFESGEPEIVSPITFDDATINGIFPDMSNARWQQLTGLTAPPVPPPAKVRQLAEGGRR